LVLVAKPGLEDPGQYIQGGLNTVIIQAPISLGELIDKITILRLKAQLITDSVRVKNVEIELEMLEDLQLNLVYDQTAIDPLEQQLYSVNRELWHIENYKRQCEQEQNFGDGFVLAARQVYLKNDQRALIKKQINVSAGSTIVEEKSY
jgi:hypothetical protein